MSAVVGRATAASLLGLASIDIHVSWQPTPDQAPTSEPVHLYLALDNSGSMAGTPLRVAKEAVVAFLQQVAVPANPFNLVTAHLLVFNSAVVMSQDLFGLTQDTIAQVVGRISAGGGTSFTAVLHYLQDLASMAPTKDNHVIIFFTDGEDYSPGGPRAVGEVLAGFKGSFTSRRTALQMHCLGFGASHDAAFLSELTLAGSEPGSFQYISDVSGQMTGALERVTAELEAYSGTGKRLRATLQLGGAGGGACLPLSLWLQEPPDPATGTPPLKQLHVFVGKVAYGACAAEALAQQGSVVLEGPGTWPGGRVLLPVTRREVGLQEVGSLALEVVQQQVIRWTNQIANQQLDLEGLRAVRDKVLAMRQDLARMQGRARELLPLGRGVYRSTKAPLLQAATLMGRFEGEIVAAALADSLTNHAVASLNDLAYRSVSKAGLRRGLDKRVGANVGMMESLEEQIKGLVESMKEELEGLPGGEEFGVCAISCCTYKEALQVGDCLCLGLDIERPEAAIMDPSRLVIKSIAPTRITADSFMDALAFALGAGRAAEEVHGGFERGAQAQVVVGEGREPITGALPLYINPQHWAVARLQARPLLGWMCTLNPLGYSDEQLRTVPFLVLGRALKELSGTRGELGGAGNGGSRFHTWVADQVLQTCLAVYRLRRRRFLADLTAAPPPAQGTAEGGTVKAAWGLAAAASSGAALTGVEEGVAEEAGAGADKGKDGDAVGPELPPMPLAGKQLSYLRDGPAARTLDIVPSTPVWLLWLLCAVASGDVALAPEDCRTLRLAVLEEELRRSLPKPDYEAGHAASLLCISPSLECDLATAQWLRENEEGGEAAAGTGLEPSSASGKSQALMAALECIVRSMAEGRDWERQLDTLGQGVEAQRAQAGYKARVLPTLRLLARLEQVATAATAVASGGGVGFGREGFASETGAQAAQAALASPAWEPPALLLDWEGELPGWRLPLVALLLQNAAGVRNADRRACIAEGKYVDPFADPKNLLQRAYIEVVTQRVRSSANAIRDARQRAAAEERAARFASAPSLKSAADALSGWRLGARYELAALLTALQAPGLSLLQQKVGLLMAVSLKGPGAGRLLRGDKPGPRLGSKKEARARARAEYEDRKRQREKEKEMAEEGRAAGIGLGSPASVASPSAGATGAISKGAAVDAAAASPREVRGWMPSRRRVFSFLRAHWSEVGPEEALALFGRCQRVTEEYLRTQYATGFAAQRPAAAPA